MTEVEYSKPRSLPEFHKWVKNCIQEMQTDDEMSRQYRDREGHWKQFANEARPLSNFLAQYHQCPTDAVVHLTVDNRPFDAKIDAPIGGFLVEVTTTENAENAFQREHLNKYGVAFGGTVKTSRDLAKWRNADQPFDEGGADFLADMVQQAIDAITDRLKNKINKPHYLPNTLLVVYSDASDLKTLNDHALIATVSGKIQNLGAAPFREIYLCIEKDRLVQLK